jgi:hypothetical protein
MAAPTPATSVPEHGHSPARSQDPGRLGCSSDGIDPVPALPGDHRIEAATASIPGFERRHLDDETLVLDRIARIDDQTVHLCDAAGTGTVVVNPGHALFDLFNSVAVAIVGLLMFRDDVRTRLRRSTPSGVPVLAEATAMIAAYLGLSKGWAGLGEMPMSTRSRPLWLAPRTFSSPAAATLPRKSMPSKRWWLLLSPAPCRHHVVGDPAVTITRRPDCRAGSASFLDRPWIRRREGRTQWRRPRSSQ